MILSAIKSTYQYKIDDLLKEAATRKASDLHMVAKLPPLFRINGEMITSDFPVLEPEDIQLLLMDILNEEQKAELLSNWELDFSYAVPKYARYRGNVIVQRGTMDAVFRVVPFKVPELEKLSLPEDVKRLCELPRGLILITGPTGSGKSTTMAGMIDYMNRHRAINILTIEDPIEFLHSHKLATIRQREVGTDTKSFAVALRQALRHDPDVILIGEMRDQESISIALTAAETGHLVLSTLHTQTAPSTITRIIDSYPNDKKTLVCQQLAGSLRAIISQQLIEDLSGNRVAAIEYMVDTPNVRSMIREGKEHQLYSAIQTGKEVGMQTMDQCLVDLAAAGRISYSKMIQYCVDQKEIVRLAQSYGI